MLQPCHHRGHQPPRGAPHPPAPASVPAISRGRPTFPGRPDRAAPDMRPGRPRGSAFPQARGVHSNPLRSRERRFESCRGHFQRHKSEHSGNPGRAEARAPDLRRCGRAPEPVPDTCPESAAMNKSLLLRPTGVHGLLAVRSLQTVAPAPTPRLCGASGHDPPPAETGQAPGGRESPGSGDVFSPARGRASVRREGSHGRQGTCTEIPGRYRDITSLRRRRRRGPARLRAYSPVRARPGPQRSAVLRRAGGAEPVLGHRRRLQLGVPDHRRRRRRVRRAAEHRPQPAPGGG